MKPDFVQFDGKSVRARFADTDTQIKAKDAITKALNPDAAEARYIVALNLVSRSPQWMAASARCRCTWAWTCAAACTS
jgi:preprotein translocase subunit SecD